MGILYLTIIVSLLLACAFLLAFLWSVKNGQYDDSYTPSVRMLFEDESKTSKSSKKKSDSRNNNSSKSNINQ